MILFFAISELEYRPLIVAVPGNKIQVDLGIGSPVLIKGHNNVIARGTVISDFFNFEEGHLDMLQRHYGYTELPKLVGTYSYHETYFESPEQ